MKNLKISKYSIVEIEWMDHYYTSGWRPEPEKIPTYLCKSVGHFIMQDKYSVLISMSMQEADKTTGDSLTILRSCITKITVLKKA